MVLINKARNQNILNFGRKNQEKSHSLLMIKIEIQIWRI